VTSQPRSQGLFPGLGAVAGDKLDLTGCLVWLIRIFYAVTKLLCVVSLLYGSRGKKSTQSAILFNSMCSFISLVDFHLRAQCRNKLAPNINGS